MKKRLLSLCMILSVAPSMSKGVGGAIGLTEKISEEHKKNSSSSNTTTSSSSDGSSSVPLYPQIQALSFKLTQEQYDLKSAVKNLDIGRTEKLLKVVTEFVVDTENNTFLHVATRRAGAIVLSYDGTFNKARKAKPYVSMLGGLLGGWAGYQTGESVRYCCSRHDKVGPVALPVAGAYVGHGITEKLYAGVSDLFVSKWMSIRLRNHVAIISALKNKMSADARNVVNASPLSIVHEYKYKTNELPCLEQLQAIENILKLNSSKQ